MSTVNKKISCTKWLFVKTKVKLVVFLIIILSNIIFNYYHLVNVFIKKTLAFAEATEKPLLF